MKQWLSYLLVLLVVPFLMVVNLLFSSLHYSIDLTQDKRYSLSDSSIELLENMEEPLLIEVLFEGDFPAGYQELQNRIKTILRKFQSYHNNIRLTYANPLEGSEEERDERMQAFSKIGLVPFPISYPGEQEFRSVQSFPYVIFTQKEKRVIVPILTDASVGGYSDEQLNKIGAQLEYKFINAVDKLQRSGPRKIAFIESQEIGARELYGLRSELSRFYEVAGFSLDSVDFINPAIDLLFIPLRDMVLQERQLLAIDQYIMQGGKVIWMIESTSASLDSIGKYGSYTPIINQSSAESMLFKYGIRINPNLVVDRNAGKIPLVTSNVGGNPQMELFNWYYFPIPKTNTLHPITNNIGDIKLQFPASIDTLPGKNSKDFTVLLSSSDYSNVQSIPRNIDFQIATVTPDPSYFNSTSIPMAVIVEGLFDSYFKNRLTSENRSVLQDYGLQFMPSSKATKQLFVSDIDFALTQVSREGRPVPLGYDATERRDYLGNRDFLINAVEYMIGNPAILQAKSKKIELRLLDTIAAQSQKSKFQFINLVLPLLLVIGLGWLFNFLRKRKYQKPL